MIVQTPFILAQIHTSLVDLLDYSKTSDGRRVHTYSIVPANAEYPYIRLSNVTALEEMPCFAQEYVINCSIVDMRKTYTELSTIFNDVAHNINENLKYYFDRPVIIRFQKANFKQIRENILTCNFTLTIKI